MKPPLQTGLLILHGNRLESLRDTVFEWLARHPLAPLEEEIFLVQSNGAAEWLKMSLARVNGICAATRVELPGRFFWRTYRQVLGRDRIPPRSVLEREALTWRLMRLLPEQLARPLFEPVAAFLADADLDRRLQLARQIADLYDQYQVYRADWLDAWERGRPVLADTGGQERPLAADQRWQMALWRAILDELTRDDRWSIRPLVHRAFLAALAGDADVPGSPAGTLPRRVVLFGASHVSPQGLEALAALSSRVQVVFAIPNPCRFHWADIIEGREALRAMRRRQPAAAGGDLSTVPFDAMHLHAHPLLAAWGRQGRDFMRLLDVFDDAEARRRFDAPRIDLFDDGPGTTLLQQLQANIRDLVPLADHARQRVAGDDRSIVFEIAHGPQREVEILHDRLLALFAADPQPTRQPGLQPGLQPSVQPLRPRDVIVMVPDIETFAPAIRAVFGQHRREDPRHIPFDIADLQSRGSNPLIVAVEWLLRIAEQRFRLQELRDLLDVPAVAARFGVDVTTLPQAFAWLEGAGVRWGLHAGQRRRLGLETMGEQNSWAFGLRRMLLGYASGPAAAFDDIDPYDEIGGLDAAVIGSLVDLFERLDAWWALAAHDAAPIEWAARGRELLATFAAATDERERLTVAALQTALSTWLDACDIARFIEPVPLSVFREAWLSGIEGLDASRRFLTGGVTFCTLMPLRSVPFEVVCLLGMNDGDFPRQGRRDDFDLMTLAGQQRPGDRSRRDDDRYLMLEALLSARRVLSLSWCGRSARDNGEQPPSVLVAQLRDYLDAGWLGDDAGRSVSAALTTVHPLQPFSRRYFEGGALATFAREWHAAHVEVASSNAGFDVGLGVGAGEAAVSGEVLDASLTIARLVRFLRNPVREYFAERLGIRLPDDDETLAEDESFGLDGLDAYGLLSELLADAATLVPADAAGAPLHGSLDQGVDQRIDQGVDARIDERIASRLARIRGAGRLPLFGIGERSAAELAATARPMLARWAGYRTTFPDSLARRPLRFEHHGASLDDRLEGLRGDGSIEVAVTLTASRLLEQGGAVRPARLVAAWVTMLAAGACGHEVTQAVIGADTTLFCGPLDRAAACAALRTLVDAWIAGMAEPLPFALETALAQVEGGDPAAKYDGGFGREHGEGAEFCLQRVHPDFDTLVERGFEHWVEALFRPLVEWAATSVTVVSFADVADVGEVTDPAEPTLHETA